ncbi:hypothetical protein HK104_008184, partial [Borealophlyctis nickersoniae]
MLEMCLDKDPSAGCIKIWNSALVLNDLPPGLHDIVPDADASTIAGCADLIWAQGRPSAVLLALSTKKTRSPNQDALFLSSCTPTFSSIWDRTLTTASLTRAHTDLLSHISQAPKESQTSSSDPYPGLTPAVLLIEPIVISQRPRSASRQSSLKELGVGVDSNNGEIKLEHPTPRESVEITADFAQMVDVLAKKHELRFARDLGNI